MMLQVYRHVLPRVHDDLGRWQVRAQQIPNNELRKQALQSIASKTFHCEGGAIFALLAKQYKTEAIHFIVAYQTISDYLDNLCDRSTSQDPADFRALHEAMLHALTPDAVHKNYYRFRLDQEDGGYLDALVDTCQRYLRALHQYDIIATALLELAGYYCNLQVYKHVAVQERLPRLQSWFSQYRDDMPEMSWYEFAACAGSTLGIFCIVSYAAHQALTLRDVTLLKDGYFPWVQGLHILLDYFIDQEEDRLAGDLNFCDYYDNQQQLLARFIHFIQQADTSIASLPDARFHHMINHGLLGIYLADPKVQDQKKVRKLAKQMKKQSGGSGLFFFLNGWFYRRLRHRL